tara:strand:- start:100 stop:522 length:423 start_codon:yes stop_codon:yes gene_type:complete
VLVETGVATKLITDKRKGDAMNNYVYAGLACLTLVIISYNAINTKIEVRTVEVEKVVYKDRQVEKLELEKPAITIDDLTITKLANVEFDDLNLGNWVSTNGLTFPEAFKFYRDKYGKGTVFMWHGDYYHTYFKEEYDDKG